MGASNSKKKSLPPQKLQSPPPPPPPPKKIDEGLIIASRQDQILRENPLRTNTVSMYSKAKNQYILRGTPKFLTHYELDYLVEKDNGDEVLYTMRYKLGELPDTPKIEIENKTTGKMNDTTSGTFKNIKYVKLKIVSRKTPKSETEQLLYKRPGYELTKFGKSNLKPNRKIMVIDKDIKYLK